MSVAVVTFLCHQYPSHDPDQKQISIRSCDRTCHTSSCKYFNTYSMGHIDSTFMGKYWLVINIQPYYLPATGDGYEVCTDTYTYDASCFFFFCFMRQHLSCIHGMLHYYFQYSFFVCYIHCFKAMNLPMLRPPYSMLSCGWG